MILHWLNQIFAEANGFIIPWHSLLDRYGKTIYSENEQLNAQILHLKLLWKIELHVLSTTILQLYLHGFHMQG